MSKYKLYGKRWDVERREFLRKNPLCVMHAQLGKRVASAVVDHIKRHEGDYGLFWDKSNWQALCKQCHDSHKQRSERTGIERGCDVLGNPVSAKHHWDE